jgi:serine protease Do
MILKIQMVAGCLVGFMATSFIQSAIYAPATIAKTVTEQTASSVYKRANPAVVTVRVGERSHGSGFIISQDGWVITNAHVVDGAPSVVTLMMADGKTEISADVVGFARGGADLALLKINGRRKLPIVKLGSSKSIEVGDQVYAIGTPLLEERHNTFTTGIVTALRDGYIQHGASIDQGNSGGPLLNNNSEVIGVNTAIAKSQPICSKNEECVQPLNSNIVYAVSLNVLIAFLADIKAGNISSVSTLVN